MTVVTHPQLPALRFPKRSTVIAAAVAGLAVAGIAAFAGTGNTTTSVDSVVSTDTGINSSVAEPQLRHPSDIGGVTGGGVTVNPGIAQEMLAAQAQQYGLSGLSPASMAPVGAAAGSGVAVNPGTAQEMLAAQAQQYGLSGLSPASMAPVDVVPQDATSTEALRNVQYFLDTNGAVALPQAVNPGTAQETLAAFDRAYILNGQSPATIAPVDAGTAQETLAAFDRQYSLSSLSPAAAVLEAENSATPSEAARNTQHFLAINDAGQVPKAVDSITPSEAAANTQHFMEINDAAPAIAASESTIANGWVPQ